jgi:hypothetical protein
MTVTLIFPTGTDPRSPHLALPYLAATLRRAGLEVELLDLDLGGLLALLEPDVLARAGRQLRKKAAAAGPEHAAWNRLLGLAESLPERAADALAALRHPVRFYDPNEFNSARETIGSCLDLVSAAAPTPLRYSICPVCYDVDGVDVQSLAGLIRVTADRDANLFADYWEASVFPKLQRQRPNLVGITITNRQQVIPGLTLARRLRERGHFVVLGGTVYTKFARQLATLPAFFEHFADGVIVYEGDTALPEVVGQLEGGRDFARVPNFLYLNRGQVHATHTHVEDVNALPAPDFAGLPLHDYLTPEPVLPILFGKGCYFNRCKFCDIPFINHVSPKAYRIRAPERVAADVLELRRRFGCRHFEFTDEALPPRLLAELAGFLAPHRDEDFCFVGYARLEPTFTPELCARLAGMGVKKLFFGLESGAQETLDHMDKGIRVADVPAVLRNCRDAGICVHIFSIIGFPEESEASARKTFQFFQDNVEVIDHPGNSFDIHPFGLELRTRYAEEAGQMLVQIDPRVLAREFVIGVGDRWTNPRGLSPEQVEVLLGEFQPLLRRLYRRYHACPLHLWPGFEEFAVLYADRFGRRPFPYRTSLPDDADPRPYRLRWNPAALVEEQGDGKFRVCLSSGEVDLDRDTYQALGSRRFRPVRALLAEYAGDDPGGRLGRAGLIREMIDGLIEQGLLQLEPYPDPEPRRTVADGIPAVVP